ncbi:MAG: hypothetical protein WCG34_13135 [Leptolinea sp.]
MNSTIATPAFDLKTAVAKNRQVGLWHILSGFRLTYLTASLAQGFAALAKTATYFLLRYFVDTYQSGAISIALPLLAFSFLGLAAVEGAFTFLAGSYAARTADGITRRLRNLCHPSGDVHRRNPFIIEILIEKEDGLYN